jgi:uroporphyrinogen III methyltransferase/synthase
VDEVIVYRAVTPPGADVAGLRRELEAGAIDVLTFTSSSTVRNFVEMLGRPLVARLVRDGRPAIACIGPVTAETAADLGLPADITPSEYTVAALTAAVEEHFRTIRRAG